MCIVRSIVLAGLIHFSWMHTATGQGPWSFESLTAKADLVVIANCGKSYDVVKTIDYGDENFLQIETLLQIQSVLKKVEDIEFDGNELMLSHFRLKKGAAFGGKVGFIVFSEERERDRDEPRRALQNGLYLFFLVKDKGNKFVPATGQTRSIDSIMKVQVQGRIVGSD